MNRRGFLQLLGITAVAAAVMPLEELIDRAGFAQSPTTSLLVREPGLVQVDVHAWEDELFREYARNDHFAAYMGSSRNQVMVLPRNKTERIEWIVDPKRALVMR